MKVLLINGSPRREGNTYTALCEVARQLEVQGIESEIVWVGTRPVRGCIACGKCKQQGNNRCVFDDDVTNEVIGKMEQCDAIIVGSPVYWGQPSGQLLCLQQRMLYAGGAMFKDKPAVEDAAVVALLLALCRRCGLLPSRRSHRSLPDHAHALPDVQHAHRDIAVLEYRLRTRCRRVADGHRGYADHAYAGQQHGLAAEENQRHRHHPAPRARGLGADEFYQITLQTSHHPHDSAGG